MHFSKDHEWVRLDGDVATVGITQYAADALGDVVFVETPMPGKSSARATGSPSSKASRRLRTSMPRCRVR